MLSSSQKSTRSARPEWVVASGQRKMKASVSCACGRVSDVRFAAAVAAAAAGTPRR